MHEKAKDFFKREESKEIKCGTWIFVFNAPIGYWWKKPCGKWHCDECCKAKTKNYQYKISALMPGPHVFVTEVENTGRSLTQLVQRRATGGYVIVRKKEGAILITRFKISERCRSKEKFLCVRKSKDKYLKGEFAESLRQPFTGGKKITSSRGEKKPERERQSYGFLRTSDTSDDGKKAKEENRKIIDEYSKLKNDTERGRWLMEHRKQILMSSKGDRLIEECENMMRVKIVNRN